MEGGKGSATTVHGKKEVWELLKKCSFMVAVKKWKGVSQATVCQEMS